MRKGKLRAASATGSRSSGNCTVTSRSLSTKLPKKFRAVSVNPLTIPTPNIILCPRSAYLRRVYRSTVDFSHDDINAPQNHHHIRDVVTEAHILEHREVDQARRPHPVTVRVRRAVTDQIETQLPLRRFNPCIGFAHLGP